MLGVMNELLGAVLSKLGHPPFSAPSPISLPFPQWVGVPGEEDGAESWALSLPAQAGAEAYWGSFVVRRVPQHVGTHSHLRLHLLGTLATYMTQIIL